MHPGRIGAIAGSIAVVASVSLAGCAHPVAGTASYRPDIGAPTYSLVKVGELPLLLLNVDEVSAVMKAPFTVVARYVNLDFSPAMQALDRKCVGAMLAGAEPMYRGSHYGGVAGFGQTGPDDRVVDESVAAFPDAVAAASFVTTRVAQWHDCLNKVLTLHPPDKPEANFVSTATTTSYGVGIFPRTQEGTDFGCSHGLAARSNVVADVLACSHDQAALNDQVSTMANRMLGAIVR